jgi:hypothetical protein
MYGPLWKSPPWAYMGHGGFYGPLFFFFFFFLFLNLCLGTFSLGLKGQFYK